MPLKNKRSHQQQKQKNATNVSTNKKTEKVDNNCDTKRYPRQQGSTKSFESLDMLFSVEELRSLRTQLRVHDAKVIPSVLAATVLNKFSLVERLTRQCCNLNEFGPNHMTALMWAVKEKYTEIADYLLAHGADPTAKNDNGDNAILLALESKLWDERSFLNLWKHVESKAFIDVDYTSKSCQYMIHTAIKREWCSFLKILISKGVNVNVENSNHMTSLMMASYCNYPEMVDVILSAHPDITKENCNGCTAICYAANFALSKNLPLPHHVMASLLKTLNSSPEKFLCTRIHTILQTSQSDKPGDQQNVSETQKAFLTYCLKYNERNACAGLADFGFFNRIEQTLEECCVNENFTEISRLVKLIEEILTFTEGGIRNVKLADSFLADGGANACLQVSKINDIQLSQTTFMLIVLICLSKTTASKIWLKSHLVEVSSVYKTISLKGLSEETTTKLTQFEEMIKIVETVKREIPTPKPPTITPNSKPKEMKKCDGSSSKAVSDSHLVFLEMHKSTSRAKFRYDPGSQQSRDPRSPWRQFWQMENENVENFPSAEEIGRNGRFRGRIEDETYENADESCDMLYFYPKWREVGPEYVDDRNFCKRDDEKENYEEEEEDVEEEESEEDDEFRREANYREMIDYLSDLLEKIMQSYRDIWKPENETKDKFDPARIRIENEYIDNVRASFESLSKRLKNSTRENESHVVNVFKKLKSLLINHKVRGRRVFRRVSDESDQEFDKQNSKSDRFKNTNSDNESEDIDEYQVTPPPPPPTPKKWSSRPVSPQHPEDKQPDAASLDCGEETTGEENDVQSDTMKSAYHLIPSIMRMCDEETDARKKSSPSYLGESCGTKWSLKRQQHVNRPCVYQQKQRHHQRHQNGDSRQTFDSSMSRWCEFVKSLETSNNFRWLLDGDVRIAGVQASNGNNGHTISAGGNFSAVVLGLDAHNRPLAVKRVRKSERVTSVMHGLVEPLLELRNRNVLPYFACTFEKQELILVTPLCEYNMGEYIMLTKSFPNMFSRYVEIVRQFLSGLRFLHEQDESIVHGNLKPSNIFLDQSGTVRVAEFGMHQVLYKLVQAPNSSIIWFSRETFNSFKEASGNVCTCASDVQVAGMLAHFVITAGRHPYGDTMEEILGNLERGVPQMYKHQVDFHDLVTWMLLYEPTERPNIGQVLSHVFFWGMERKWRFLLACGGLTTEGTDLGVDLDELHTFIDAVAERENIRGRWLAVTRHRYPGLEYSRCERDTLVGLLCFVRQSVVRHRGRKTTWSNEVEFRDFVLTMFPAVPLSLYRILESSSWFKNCGPLRAFVTIDQQSAF